MKKVKGVDNIRQLLVKSFEWAKQNQVERVEAIGNLDVIHQTFPEIEINSSSPFRTENGITSRFIYSYSGGAVYKAVDPLYKRESKYMPVDLDADLTIMGDKVIFGDLANQTAWVSDDPVVADNMRKLFQSIWRM